MIVTIYNTTNGIIDRICNVPDANAAQLQCATNEAWLEGSADSESKLVKDGVFVPRILSEDEKKTRLEQSWMSLRIERNQRLSICDWTQIPDAPLTETQKEEWQTYRQALRDLPSVTTDPTNPAWPQSPSIEDSA